MSEVAQEQASKGPKGDKQPSEPIESPTNRWANLVGWYFVSVACLIGIIIWWFFKIDDSWSERSLLLLVTVSGAVGSFLHAATSFASYVGNRRAKRSWIWWYVLRPFIGVSLALIFYFVVRGGFLANGADPSAVNPYGIAAVAGLAGMFSKQATDKLREVFDSLFKTEKGDDMRKDKLGGEFLVKDVMIPIDQMEVFTMAEGQTDKDIKIKQLYSKFQGIVTRLPILTSNGAARYIIHQSLLFKYIARGSLGVEEQPPFDPDAATLEDFLQHPEIGPVIKDSLAFVPITATVADAQERMEKHKNCQDVFVTKTGEATEEVEGWLPNSEIATRLRT